MTHMVLLWSSQYGNTQDRLWWHRLARRQEGDVTVITAPADLISRDVIHQLTLVPWAVTSAGQQPELLTPKLASAAAGTKVRVINSCPKRA
jgi:hypothetical protein